MKCRNITGLLCGMALLTFGCSQNNPTETERSNSPASNKTEVKQPSETKAVAPAAVGNTETNTSEGPDTYGRLPGDEHYGHSHAPDVNPGSNAASAAQGSPVLAPPASTATGPDAYGRNPGDEHYGHDHE